MRTRSYLILSIGIIIIFACDLSAILASDSSEDVGEDLSVQEQIEATSKAQQSATAEIEKAVDDALTALAPLPSDTPVPATDTPEATDTATPTATSTSTQTPTKKPVVSYQTSSGDCKNETGNIEFKNNTGTTATVDLVMKKKNRTCKYFIFLAPVGSSWFWVEPGFYTITMRYCDEIEMVDNTLNSGWWFRFGAC